jgi:uncharacterized protein
MERHDHVQALARRVQEAFAADAGGHDWWHVWRVWQMARRLALAEGADVYLVELAALGHDVEDWKLERPAGTLRGWLEEIGVGDGVIERVEGICRRVSFKGARVPDEMPSLEGKIVQDADRLDAIGAIAVARTFAYGAVRGRPIYDPAEEPTLHGSFEHYRTSNSSSLMHFYEKLFLLKDRLHTASARAIAQGRHAFMERYVEQFLAEWEGKG